MCLRVHFTSKTIPRKNEEDHFFVVLDNDSNLGKELFLQFNILAIQCAQGGKFQNGVEEKKKA